MKAVILAGGEGRRLKPLTNSIPKILLPICNKPVLHHLLSSLSKQKIIDGVILSLGILWEKVVSFLASDNPPLPCELKVENEPLDTGGAVKFSAPFEDEFFVINGDIICDVDFQAMLDFHRRKKAEITILVVKVEDVSPFGSVIFDGDFKIREFKEKVEEKRTGFVNGAIYLMNRRILEQLPTGRLSLEKDVFPRLLRENRDIYAFLHLGYWIDIGERERYLQVHKDVLNGIAFLEYTSFPYQMEKEIEVHSPVLLGRGCKLGSRVKLFPYSVLGNGVEVEEEASISESVILDGAKIGKGAIVSRSIVGECIELPPGAVIKEAIIA